MSQLITQERVKELFSYNNGSLIWSSSNGGAAKGAIAGCLNKARGYIVIGINRNLYAAHRLIFLWHHGYLPNEIDHKNGIKQDNKIENLRECTRTQNSCNRPIQSNNKSGIKGVCWCKTREKWVAYVWSGPKKKHVGYFVYKQNAALALKIVRNDLHGEFAHHG